MDILLPWENLEHLSYHFHLESSQFTTDLANSSVRVWRRTSDWCKSNLRSSELKFQQDLRPYNSRLSLTALVVDPVTLTNLTTLSVVNDFGGEAATIFDRVALPALEDLAYEAITPCRLTLDSSDTPHMDMFLNIGRLKGHLLPTHLLHPTSSLHRRFRHPSCPPHVGCLSLFPPAQCLAMG